VVVRGGAFLSDPVCTLIVSWEAVSSRSAGSQEGRMENAAENQGGRTNRGTRDDTRYPTGPIVSMEVTP
jgi:hypothetical protein